VLKEMFLIPGRCRPWRRAIAISLASLLFTCFASFAQQSTKPITRKGLEDAVKIGGLKPAELVAIIKKRGVDFAVTPDVEIELLRLGAKPEIIDAARANYRGAPPSRTMQTALSGNWVGSYVTCAQGQSTLRVRLTETDPEDIRASFEIAMPNGAPATFTVSGILNTLNSFLALQFAGWQHQPPGLAMGNIGGYVTYVNQKPAAFSGIIRAPGCGQITLRKQ
jgi:hypothetical protein